MAKIFPQPCCVLLPELYGCCARCGGPRALTKPTDAILDCVCRKRTFLHRSLILKSQQNRIDLVNRPACHQMAAHNPSNNNQTSSPSSFRSSPGGSGGLLSDLVRPRRNRVLLAAFVSWGMGLAMLGVGATSVEQCDNSSTGLAHNSILFSLLFEKKNK